MNNDFIHHLEELRRRIIWCIVFVISASIFAYSFTEEFLSYIARPVGRLVFIQPQEAFLAYLKIAVFSGFLISLPLIIYHIWAFVCPGLKPEEKRYVLFFLPAVILFFCLGCVFAYFVMIPFCVKFLLSFSSNMLVPMISAGSYVSFFCVVILIFGFVFELPVVILLLSRIGIINPVLLRKNRKYVILAIFITAAVLTPPDVFSQIIMAMPLLILYELSIWISYLLKTK